MNQIENWRTVFQSYCQKSFKKIRIRTKRIEKPLKPEMLKMILLRNSLLQKKGNQRKVDELNRIISEMEAQENRDKIMKHFKSMSDNPESVNLSQM